MRVGGTEPFPVNVRFLAATNRNLGTEVTAGRFRADLYFRLNVVHLALPPLRDRRDDVPILAYYFLKKFSVAMGKPVETIAPEALKLLSRYPFAGNVRELANLIERGVALVREDTLEVAHLPESIKSAPPPPPTLSTGSLQSLEQNEAAYISQVLDYTGGNRNQAAEILGIDRVSLWRRIKRYGLAETE